MKTLGSFNTAYWLRHMWGHTDFCTCPICASLRRVLPLIGDGTRLPGFAGLALNHLRQLEGELRDIYEHCLRETRGVPANRQAAAPPPDPEGSEPKPPKEEAPKAPPETAEVGESKAEASQPEPKKPAKELPLQLTAKSKPPEPPSAGGEVVPKVESHSDPDNLVDVKDAKKEDLQLQLRLRRDRLELQDRVQKGGIGAGQEGGKRTREDPGQGAAVGGGVTGE